MTWLESNGIENAIKKIQFLPPAQLPLQLIGNRSEFGGVWRLFGCRVADLFVLLNPHLVIRIGGSNFIAFHRWPSGHKKGPLHESFYPQPIATLKIPCEGLHVQGGFQRFPRRQPTCRFLYLMYLIECVPYTEELKLDASRENCVISYRGCPR